MSAFCVFLFFFSSRRRHTRFKCDWSSDVCSSDLRLAALSRAMVVFVWSHDSVGVGEDGPTHQPVEHLATLRAIPGLQVIRPADANETVAAWKAAIAHD